MRANKRAAIVGTIGIFSAVVLGLGWLWAYPMLAAAGATALGYVLVKLASGKLRLPGLRRVRSPHHGSTDSAAPSALNPKDSAGRSGADPKRVVKCRPEPDEPNDVDALVDRMLAQGRFALLLRPQIARNLNDEHSARARAALEEEMALVPDGEVVLGSWDEALDDGTLEEEEIAACRGRVVRVERFFLDRYPVTNRQFHQFVAGGGYQQIALWDEKIWPAVLDFVDQTGQPGPRYWRGGSYPAGQENHPVVGVSWYEAVAFARWTGKRLPTDAEWVKAGSWPVSFSNKTRAQRRYPWGDTMDRSRANLWGSGPEGTVPVDQFPNGVSVGGVYHLIGNVWEWTRGDLNSGDYPHRDLLVEVPMKSIRGGAFDTYFDNQATCQFQSGEAAMARKRNIGFRCAVGVCDLMLTRQVGDPEVAAEGEGASVEEVQV